MKFVKTLLPCLLLLCSASFAQADWGGFGSAYYGYGGFQGGGIRPYVPVPPYFALHPPVYYGQRYTRPYGASPFAAGPQLQTNSSYAPQIHVDRAITIENPHVPGGCTNCGNSGIVQQKPAQPLVIDNPFFVPEVQYTSAGR